MKIPKIGFYSLTNQLEYQEMDVKSYKMIYRRSDVGVSTTSNNPFVENYDAMIEEETGVTGGGGQNQNPPHRSCYNRRFSLQHQSYSTTATAARGGATEAETLRAPMAPNTPRTDDMTNKNKGFNNSTLIYLDSLDPQDLRRVALKLAEERDNLLQEINVIAKHNHLLRRQLHRSTSRSRLSRNFSQNDPDDQSLVPSLNRDHMNFNETPHPEDLFLLPEDLKESPSKISVMLSQSMTVLAQINNQEVIEKVYAGSHIAKQLVIGNVVGYCSAHIIRKFGKLAAGSFIGSFCLIKLAHHRGYISVDWKRIQQQIEHPTGQPTSAAAAAMTADPDEDDKYSDIAWVSKKIHQGREWCKDNTYTVMGFCAGFALNNLTCF